MKYALYRGFILESEEGIPGYSPDPTFIYTKMSEVLYNQNIHTSSSDGDARDWIDTMNTAGGGGSAIQEDVNKLNSQNIKPPYPDNIMKMVRQMLGGEEYSTSYDKRIAQMSKNEVFDNCLRWEGIIGYDYQIKAWIWEIYGIKIE